MLASFAAISVLIVSPTLGPREDPPPPPPQARCVRYFSLDGEVKTDLLRKALIELGTADAPGRIVVGPSVATCRPKLSFVALEVPAAWAAKDVARALKKSCRSVDELVWTSFRGVDRQLPSILGVSAQDCVIGMASDMRWFEASGDEKYFFYLPGKLDADAIADKFRTLFEPFDAGDVGTLVSETFTFALAASVDAAALKRATKAIGKLDGVRKVDGSGSSLTIEVKLDGLRASAVSDGASQASAFGDSRAVMAALHPGKTRPSFYADAVTDVLAKEQVALASR